MSEFLKVIVERTVCRGEYCSKDCTYLQAQHGGGYVCQLFNEELDDRVPLAKCLAAESRANEPSGW